MFEKIITKIVHLLNAHKIPYMLMGGQAVLLYGEPRVTRDIDISIGTTPDDLPKILKIIKTLKFKILVQDVKTFVRRTMVLPAEDSKSGIRIDFIFAYTPYERRAIQRTKKIILLNTKVSFISPEDLIIHKLFAGRPRDIEDAKSIILKNKNLDRHYIKHWLTEFDHSFQKKNFLKLFNSLLKNSKPSRI